MFGDSLRVEAARPRHIWLRGSDGDVLDEAMVCRMRSGLLLTLHGGAGVRKAVNSELKQWGATEDPRLYPFGRTPFERLTLDTLHGVRGPAAAGLVLEAAGRADQLQTALLNGDLASLLAQTDAVRFLVQQPRVQLWGPVNAGKSSLLNALCGRDLAATGAEPGLTRDVIEGEMRHRGFSFRVFDAPGVWSGRSDLDQDAQSLAEHWRQQADLTIELVPPGGSPPPSGWWYHSRSDESGLEGLSVNNPESLHALKDEIVEYFFGSLLRVEPDARWAVHPDLRADLEAVTDGNLSTEAVLAKWLGNRV